MAANEAAGGLQVERHRGRGHFGGGNLTLAPCLRAKAEEVPRPAAIAPQADMTNAGHTLRTDEWLDNVAVSVDGSIAAARKVYVPAGHDLTDPQLSPIFGDFYGMPLAIVTSGTRDLFFSDAVRVPSQAAPGRRGGAAAGLRGHEPRAICLRRKGIRIKSLRNFLVWSKSAKADVARAPTSPRLRERTSQALPCRGSPTSPTPCRRTTTRRGLASAYVDRVAHRHRRSATRPRSGDGVPRHAPGPARRTSSRRPATFGYITGEGGTRQSGPSRIGRRPQAMTAQGAVGDGTP